MSRKDKESWSLQEYLAPLPPEQRAALESLRATIRSVATGAVEGMSSGVPAFKYKGRYLASYGAAKNHLSLYVMQGKVLERMQGELAEYDATRTVVRFSPSKPLPEALVKRIIKSRMQEIDSKTDKVA